MTDTDLYELLGVGRNATDDELKRAYRAKAREFHPDTNHAGSEDDEHFKEISLAYEVLRDPERRARYDRFGHAGVFGQAAGGAGAGDPFGAGGLGDLFDAFFNGMGGAQGGRRRTGPVPGPDAETGGRALVPRGRLRGAAPGRRDRSGALRHLRGNRRPARHLGDPLPRMPGGRRTAPGPPVDPRPGRHRRALQPLPGDRPVDRDALRRLPGRGTPERVPHLDRRHPGRGGRRLHPATGRPRTGRVPRRTERRPVRPPAVTPTRCSSGRSRPPCHRARADGPGRPGWAAFPSSPSTTTATWPSPAGTQSGTVMNLKGLGVPKLRGRGRGDLYVHVQVDTPTDLDDAQRELLAAWPRPDPKSWARPRRPRACSPSSARP